MADWRKPIIRDTTLEQHLYEVYHYLMTLNVNREEMERISATSDTNTECKEWQYFTWFLNITTEMVRPVTREHVHIHNKTMVNEEWIVTQSLTWLTVNSATGKA